MAAGLGFKTFATGDVLSAGDTNGYLMQGVWVFATAAARDAAVTAPEEGNTCYLKDTDVIQCYSGSAWVTKSGTAGKIAQVIFGSTSTGVSSASTTYADTGLTATITPSASSSKVLVFVNHAGTRKAGADTAVGLRLVRTATTLATFETTAGFTATTATNQIGAAAYMHLDSPATTSATTYKTTFNNLNAAGTAVVQVDNAVSSIILMEVLA